VHALVKVRTQYLLAAILAIAGAGLVGTLLVNSAEPPPAAKQALFDREATFGAGGFDLPGTPDPNKGKVADAPYTPGPILVPHAAAGAGMIVENGQAPFPSSSYSFQNHWYEESVNSLTIYYAGALGKDPQQGVLVLEHMTPDFHQRLAGNGTAYKTPSRVGAVRIVGAQGEVLHLIAQDGSDLYFDAASRQFVNPAITAVASAAAQ
jgi:hypothetical protein